MTKNTKTKNGFTLVELAIVLMIIGLLIGGILKGQELIKNARITSTLAQLDSYNAAVLTFQDGYGMLPGDITNPGTRLPNCSTAMCNFAGDGNGRIGPFNATVGTQASAESNTAWMHLQVANLITAIDLDKVWSDSDHDAASWPQAKMGGNILFRNVNEAPNAKWPDGAIGTYWLFARGGGTPAASAATMDQFARIDRKIDDGKPCFGIVIGREYCDTNNGAAAYDPNDKTVQLFLIKVGF